MALHAAAGLAAGPSREAHRLLRSAEGLVRTAIVLLRATTSPAPASPPTASATSAKRRARPRGKKGAKDKQAVPENGMVVDSRPSRPEAATAEAGSAAMAALPAASVPDVDEYMEGSELASLTVAAAVGERAPSKGKDKLIKAYLCECGYAVPISRKLRCRGCGWSYERSQLGQLQSRMVPVAKVKG